MGSSIEITKEQWENDCGTKIIIKNLKDFPNSIKKRGQKPSEFSLWRYRLGVRYRYYIENDPLKFIKMNLTMSLEDQNENIISDINGSQCLYEIKAIKPVHSSTDVPQRKTFTGGTGNLWKASVAVHYRPSSEELEGFTNEDGREQLESWHPYYFHNKKADILINGIVVQQIKMYDLNNILESSNDRSARATYLYLEILLEKGFQLVNTKNGVKDTAEFKQLKEDIFVWLQNEGITQKKNDIPLSEKNIANKLYGMFIEEYGEENVSKELTILYGKRPDFKVNNQLIELKKEQGETNDVIQLINYCILTGETKGKLIANGFSDNAKNCAKNYLDDLLKAAKKWEEEGNKKIDIKLTDLKIYLGKDK